MTTPECRTKTKKKKRLEESSSPQYKTPTTNNSNNNSNNKSSNSRRKTRSQKRNKKRKCPLSASSMEPSAKKQKKQAKSVKQRKEISSAFKYISIQIRKGGNCFLSARNLWAGNKKKNYEKNMNGYPIMAQILRVLYCVKYLPTELNWSKIKEISSKNSESKKKLDFKCIQEAVNVFIHQYNTVVKLIPSHFRFTTCPGSDDVRYNKDLLKEDEEKKKRIEEEKKFLEKYDDLLKNYMSKYKFPQDFLCPPHWYDGILMKDNMQTYLNEIDADGKEKENLAKLDPTIKIKQQESAEATAGADSQDSDSDDDYILCRRKKKDTPTPDNSQESDTSDEYGQINPGHDAMNLLDKISVLENDIETMRKRVSRKNSLLHTMKDKFRRIEMEVSALQQDNKALSKQNEKQKKELEVKKIEAGVHDVPKMVKFMVEHWDRDQVKELLLKLDSHRQFVGCGAILVEDDKYKKKSREKLEKEMRLEMNNIKNRVIVAAQIFYDRYNSRQIQGVRNITVNELQCQRG